uniref:Cadherin domain-containing protein n=1 Tax=Mesocestoides corti TaxID=53468 RepID=A0A5K3FZM1_MESCO
MTSSYLLTVVVRDSPSPRSSDNVLNSTAKVHITVTDVNDHSPEFIFPRLNSSADSLPEIKISSLEPVGHRIAKFQAKDSDIGLNGVVRYTLEGDATADGVGRLFHLSEDSGDLFTAAKLPTATEASLHSTQMFSHFLAPRT